MTTPTHYQRIIRTAKRQAKATTVGSNIAPQQMHRRVAHGHGRQLSTTQGHAHGALKGLVTT
eukprot:15448252-Alexandrium_andersonii.AAC.1